MNPTFLPCFIKVVCGIWLGLQLDASVVKLEHRPRIAEVLTEARSPQLVLLGPKVQIQHQQAVVERLLDVDESVDLKMTGHLLVEDQEAGRAAATWVRARFGLPAPSRAPLCWVLVAPGGEGLVSGTMLPDPKEWTAVLHRAGQTSSVERLGRFLRRRPEHLEARYDLVAALLPRLDHRLKALQPVATGDLDAGADTRIWGPVATAMEPLLKDGKIGLLPFAPRLPKDCPEARSPIMRDLYRKYRPLLQAQVTQFPEGRAGWDILLRMYEALGEGLPHSLLLGIQFFTNPYYRADGVDIWYRIGDSIAREARRSGDWRHSIPLLQQLWEGLVLQEVNFSWVTSVGYGTARRTPTSSEQETLGLRDRQRAWDCILQPLLEGLVRSGSAEEVPRLLYTLDAGWAPLSLGARLQALSRALGRPDLLPAWELAVGKLPAKRPLQGMFIGDLRLFHQDLPDPIEKRNLPTVLAKQGWSLSVQMVPEAWRMYLGWEQGGPRWAVLDNQGMVRLQGSVFPPTPAFLDRLCEAGCTPPLDLVRAFRKNNPELVFPLFFEVAKLQLMAETFWWERRNRLEPTGPIPPVSAEEKRIWYEYLEAFDRLLEHPLGLNAHAMSRAIRPNHCLASTSSEMSSEERSIVEDWRAIGRKHANTLEMEVSRRPGDENLWELLVSFQPLASLDLAEFYHSVEASPAREATWPSQRLLVLLGESLVRQGRWKEAVRILEPGWHRLRESSASGLRGGWDLSESLVLGYVQLGQWTDADAVMSYWLERGLGDGNAAHMFLTIRGWGYRSWSDSWMKKIREKGSR